MITLALVVLVLCLVQIGYTYVGYPLLLVLGTVMRPRRPLPAPFREWPTISITLPVFNEEAALADAIEGILATDYPVDRRQILVVSDASTDRTDEIAQRYAARGVEFLRLPQRGGKTAAENAARRLLRGEIIVNTDASVRLRPQALKSLIAAFADPAVGVASGRDVSIGSKHDSANRGEAGYIGYEMWVRHQETALGGIVGASGCFFATRVQLYMTLVPEALSRDFAAALIAKEQGYRAVSVETAVCEVPRTPSLRDEYRRKVRTVTRGIETLFYKSHLLNPVRYGSFAWMLFSHKVCRWLAPWAGVGALAALPIVSVTQVWARWALAGAGAGGFMALLGWVQAERRRTPAWLAMSAYFVSGGLAVLEACVRAVRGELNPIWQPTHRPMPGAQASGQ